MQEPLAGRVSIYTLFPLSFRELAKHSDRSLLKNLLHAPSVKSVETALSEFYLPVRLSNTLSEKFREFTLYGGYPEFLTRTNPEDRKHMKKTPKWYFMDTGILRSLMNNFRIEDGNCFENSVVSELRKGIYQETLYEDIYFARTSTGVEADALFKNMENGLTFYCEIKQRNTPNRNDIRHLRKFVSLNKSNVGLLLNMSDAIRKLEERIWNIPVHWLLC